MTKRLKLCNAGVSGPEYSQLIVSDSCVMFDRNGESIRTEAGLAFEMQMTQDILLNRHQISALIDRLQEFLDKNPAPAPKAKMIEVLDK
jgi:hypothetical protein